MPVLIVAIYLYILYLRRTYGHLDAADERYCVATEDGFNLAVFRHKPRSTRRRAQPVLLVHGLGANRLNFDAGDECSLARFLADDGFDVWLVDLRGCGQSYPSSRRWTWNFDAHVTHDIPAVIDFIAAQTGYEKIHWIGHSMGGMLLYAHLLRNGQERIASGVTLGAPVRFSPRADSYLHKLVALERLVRLLPQIPVGGVGKLFTPLVGVVNGPIVHYQMNVENVDWSIIRRAYFNIASHLAPGVIAQFLQWIRDDDFYAADGYSYRANLQLITAPLMVIAGGGDRLVPAHDVREAYDKASSLRKEYLELCQDDGFAGDYGHIDLIFGRHARREVFPRIAAWLASCELAPSCVKKGRSNSSAEML